MAQPLTSRILALSLTVVLGTGLVSADGSAAPPLPGPVAALSDCVSSDNGSPDLTGLRLSTDAVDVREASRTLTVTVDAVDTGGPGDATGIRGGYVALQSPQIDPDGEFTRFAGGYLTRVGLGQWQVTTVIPRGTHGGTWRVGAVRLEDRAGNVGQWNTDRLAEMGQPTSLDVTATPDDTPPHLRALSFTARRVDTRRTPKTVTVTARVTDHQSGVDAVDLRVKGQWAGTGAFVHLRKVPGTAWTYRRKFRVGRWQGDGAWRMYTVRLSNKGGAEQTLSWNDLKAAGFRTELDVTSRQDSSSPRLRSFSRTPAAIDVRRSGRTVSARVRATDRGSGVAEVLVSLGGAGYLNLRRVSGTPKDGVWKGRRTVAPCEAFPGTWPIFITVKDRQPEGYTHYRPRNLARHGWPTKLRVRARDNEAPQVEGPSSIRPTDDVTLTFDEDVNGIDVDSATLRKYAVPDERPSVPGVWTCADAAGGPTDCATGRVREATFDPTDPLAETGTHIVELNPEHHLAVTDLAGNPFDRELVHLSVSTP